MTTAMMSTRPVTCPECRASYKIPVSTERKSAPCKRCGAVILLGNSRLQGQESAAASAVRARSTRAQRALGAGRTRTAPSPLQVAVGILTLGGLVAVILIAVM